MKIKIALPLEIINFFVYYRGKCIFGFRVGKRKESEISIFCSITSPSCFGKEYYEKIILFDDCRGFGDDVRQRLIRR